MHIANTFSAILVLVLLAPFSCLLAQPESPSRTPKDLLVRIGTTRLRHGGVIRALAVDPKGKWLASASEDRTVSVWEIPTGKELYRLRGHSAEVLALDATSNALASAGADGTVRLWDLTSSKNRHHTFTLSSRFVEALAFSPNGQFLAAGADEQIPIWNVKQRQWTKQLTNNGSIRALAWSPDCKILACNDGDGGVRLWDVARGTVLSRMGKGTVNALAFSPARTGGGREGRGSKIYPGSRKSSSLSHRDGPPPAPPGHTLAGWTFGDVVHVWDVSTRKVLHTLKQRTGSVARDRAIYQLDFSADGKVLAVASQQGPIYLWDMKTGKVKNRLPGHAGRSTAVAFVPAKTKGAGNLLASAGVDQVIRLWNPTTGKELRQAPAPAAPLKSLTVSADGRLLATLTEAGHLSQWKLPAGTAHRLPAVLCENSSRIRAAAFAPRRQRLAVSTDKNDLLLVDVRKNKVLFHQHVAVPITQLTFTADGKVLGAIGRYRSVFLFDANSGKLLRQTPRRERYTQLVFSPDGGTFAPVGSPASFNLWTVKDGQQKQRFPGHRGGLLAVAFDPRENQLASSGKDRFLRLWDLKTGKQNKVFGGHRSWAYTLAYSSGGRVLATGHGDGTVRIWNPNTGRLLQEWHQHRGRVTGLVFANETTLISGSRDTTALVWKVSAAVLAGRVQQVRLPEVQLQARWRDMASLDSAEGMFALQSLARSPEQAINLIRKKVKPVQNARIIAWIKDLGDERFQSRTRASAELRRLGSVAEPFLRQALKNKPSLEKHRRIEILLKAIEKIRISPEEQRSLRAVALLRLIGNTEARKLLRVLANGAPQARLTRQAKKALHELDAP